MHCRIELRLTVAPQGERKIVNSYISYMALSPFYLAGLHM